MLVVDDDPIFRQLMLSRLLQLGADATEADDGTSAFHLLMSSAFDLALVDLEMPGLDGVGLIQCVRGHPRSRHIPIVVITSRSDGAALQNALAAGATAYLTKPLQWTTFASSVEFLLQLSQSAHSAQRELDDQRAFALEVLADAQKEAADLAERCRSEPVIQERLAALAAKLEAAAFNLRSRNAEIEAEVRPANPTPPNQLFAGAAANAPRAIL